MRSVEGGGGVAADDAEPDSKDPRRVRRRRFKAFVAAQAQKMINIMTATMIKSLDDNMTWKFCVKISISA